MTLEELKEIKRNIYADGRTPKSWSRIRNFSCRTVNAILRGHYGLDTPMARRVFEQLRHDGYLQDTSDAR